VHGLALTHGLTSYDAAYLEVALRRNLPLATLDADLVQASKNFGVTVLEV
jgi:predicted nucleic acid-binding protein